MSDCPDYEGVPTYGGPCWTCQDGRGPCPLDDPPARRFPLRVWAYVAFMLLCGVLTFATGHPGFVLAALPMGLAIGSATAQERHR